MRVYSKAATQESIVNLPSTRHLGGTRDYFWTFEDDRPGYPLTIYRVGGGVVPAAEYAYGNDYRLVSNERALGMLRGGKRLFRERDTAWASGAATATSAARPPPPYGAFDDEGPSSATPSQRGGGAGEGDAGESPRQYTRTPGTPPTMT
ncbi:hypothetical protein [Sorangium sp. So ce341]|uniref:hypothetical protein n=1 Tax=Sorangium sp. So ce341 TaxID=3133302 RepID=UPI003F5EFDE7